MDIGALELEVAARPRPRAAAEPAAEHKDHHGLHRAPGAVAAGVPRPARGTLVRFSLSEATAVALAVERQDQQGQHVAGALREAHKEEPGERAAASGTCDSRAAFAQAGAAGANRVRFTRPAAQPPAGGGALPAAGHGDRHSPATARQPSRASLPDPPPAPSPMTRVRRISLTVALVAATVVALPRRDRLGRKHHWRLAGTVTDSCGHGWPLYARVEVAGQTVYTDPETGRYGVELVAGTTSDIAVTALMAGYTVGRRTVTITLGNARFAGLQAAGGCAACTTPGYAVDAGPPMPVEEWFDGGAAARPAGPRRSPGSAAGRSTIGPATATSPAARAASRYPRQQRVRLQNSEDASLITPAVDLSRRGHAGAGLQLRLPRQSRAAQPTSTSSSTPPHPM